MQAQEEYQELLQKKMKAQVALEQAQERIHHQDYEWAKQQVHMVQDILESTSCTLINGSAMAKKAAYDWEGHSVMVKLQSK